MAVIIESFDELTGSDFINAVKTFFDAHKAGTVFENMECTIDTTNSTFTIADSTLSVNYLATTATTKCTLTDISEETDRQIAVIERDKVTGSAPSSSSYSPRLYSIGISNHGLIIHIWQPSLIFASNVNTTSWVVTNIRFSVDSEGKLAYINNCYGTLAMANWSLGASSTTYYSTSMSNNCVANGVSFAISSDTTSLGSSSFAGSIIPVLGSARTVVSPILVKNDATSSRAAEDFELPYAFCMPYTQMTDNAFNLNQITLNDTTYLTDGAVIIED